MDRFAAGGLEQGFAHAHPIVTGTLRVMRRHEQRRFEARHHVEPFHEANEFPERGFVVLLSRLPRADGGHACRNTALEFAKLLRPILCVLGLKRVLEPHIKDQTFVHLHDGALERSALGGVRFLPLLAFADAFAFPFHHVERWLYLVPRIMLSILVVLFVFLRKFEQRDEFGVIDPEDRPIIGRLGFHHHVGQPFDGRDDFGLFVPAFPRFQVGRLLLAQLQERVARERVHRLDPAVEHDRNPAELRIGKIRVLRRPQRADKPRGHDTGQNERQPFFHTRFLRDTNPTR